MTFEVTSPGLSSAAAETRLRVDGPNTLPAARPPPLTRQFAAQMTHFFARLLWLAGGLAIVAGMPQLGTAIFVVVVVNGGFAFAQEYRAERAAARLAELLPRRTMVVRDGRRQVVDARTVVRDDIVVVAAGDRITADLTCLTARSLTLDVSTLTGESLPTTVEPGDTMYAGTFVTGGEGLAVVRATGSHTRLADIVGLTRSVRRPRSPLDRELARVVRFVTLIAVGVGLVCLAAAVALGLGVRDGFLIAIGVMVALVPEGMLPTVTLSLAVGAQRMSQRHALVRHLEAVETLGSTTVICTDKTGTLTANEMAVVDIWTPEGSVRLQGDGYAPQGTATPDNAAAFEAARRTTGVAVKCSTGRAEVAGSGRWEPIGDPMEAAIWSAARRLDVPDRDNEAPLRFPFDPQRRRESSVHDGAVAVKGAPDALFNVCRVPDGARRAVDDLAERGLRVLAVAAGHWTGPEPPPTVDDLERNLDLVGLLAFEDPPRPSAAPAIAACRAAGVKVVMVTGDHPSTAGAIAREIGLATAVTSTMLGADLPTDLDELGEIVDVDGAVLARVDPETKLRVALALQRRGHVVAMTGDGVNDGPALQAADIGVAMGRAGTDVAREAADLVLLDDEFATIVAAIEQGRSTFVNIRRFLTYHLTDNVAELTPFVVWALSGGRFPLALGVMQVLMLDIGTDLLPALALGAEPPDPTRRSPSPRRGPRLVDRALLIRVFTRLGLAEAAIELVAFVGSLRADGWRGGPIAAGDPRLLAASGAAFGAVVIGQCANALACRSEHHQVFRSGRPRNRMLFVALVGELAVLALAWWWGALAGVLDHAPPTLVGGALALLAAPTVLAVDAVDKWQRSHRSGTAGTSDPGPGRADLNILEDLEES